jgi:hypothetical protein
MHNNIKLVLLGVAIIAGSCSCKYLTSRRDSTAIYPSSDSTNHMKVGDKVIFGSSETSGIDRQKYPADYFTMELDTAFFVKDTSYSTSDGAAGGSTSSYTEYRIIKSGATKINRFQTSYLYDDVADNGITRKAPRPETTLYATYKFEIK